MMRFFLLFSLLMLVLDVAFVVLNYYQASKALGDYLRDNGKTQAEHFELALEISGKNMLQIATLLAEDQRIQQFIARANQLQAQPESDSEAQLQRLRESLLEQMQPAWQQLHSNFDIRQIHFHLPLAQSFLRVHRPDKFGDSLADVRYMVVDSNQHLHGHTGFEIGRVYAGIRGVVPIFSKNAANKPLHVGSLEVGTSFREMLEELHTHQQAHSAVLLQDSRVEALMWKKAIARHFPAEQQLPGYYLEAATQADQLRALLSEPGVLGRFSAHSEGTELVNLGANYYALTYFPLYDYASKTRKMLSTPVGKVALWLDVSKAVQEFQRTLYLNISYAIVGFVLVELLLWFILRAGARHFEGRVAKRTARINELKEQLEVQAQTLREMNEELRQRSHLKDEFLADMSHELRTPLTSILGMTEALQEQIYGSLTPRQERALRNVDTCGRHLLNLINDILDIAKIEAGHLELERETVHLREVCQASLLFVRSQLEAKQQQLVTHFPEEAIKLSGDARRLKQVLINLLGNAIKFTPEGGQIRLELSVDKHYAAVLVEDSGMGIPDEDIAHLFQPFVRAERVEAEHYVGTGLGLVLAQRLVRLHGGYIRVRSREGKGTRFTVFLPLKNQSVDRLQG